MPEYSLDGNCIVRFGKDGSDQLTNFTAVIDKQMTYHDGNKKTTMLEISGKLHDGSNLKTITIPATEFRGLSWVPEQWGMEPIIFPASSVERDICVCIQQNSKPIKSDIYTHTGWIDIEGKKTFLTHSGGISTAGLDRGIKVTLPSELSRYALPEPTNAEKMGPNHAKNVLTDSLRIVNIGPRSVTWVMLLAAYRSAIGGSDFGIHLAGRTGTFKSEISSLIQSHFGEGMDARHMPASWSSTPNALESLAYRAKDAVMVIDDFVPTGTAWQVRQLQKGADQIIRAQGNQAGRSRLTDVSSLQVTFYPRGLILSTGEDVPEGHSIRARMMIIELSPGDIDKAKLSEAQSVRSSFAQAMSNWISWLAGFDAKATLAKASRAIRDLNLDVGHTRTPPILGDLIGTAQLMGKWMVEQKYYGESIARDIIEKATAAIMDCAANQAQYLEAADPVTALIDTIKSVVTSQLGHVKTRNGGIPAKADQWGYTVENIVGQMPTYKSHGTRIGWIDFEAGELLLDPGAMVLLKKHSGGKLAVTPQTLLKRVKEAGILTRVDDTRQRNTVRVTVEGHPKQVLAINLAEFAED